MSMPKAAPVFGEVVVMRTLDGQRVEWVCMPGIANRPLWMARGPDGLNVFARHEREMLRQMAEWSPWKDRCVTSPDAP